MRYFYIVFLFVLVLANGCANNYTLTCIREAREFALEKHPDLSDESVHWVKFTTPRINSNRIYSRDGSDASKQDIMQTVVVWNLPDQDGKSLMVVGYGERNLFNWYPNRTILKRFRVMGDPQPKKKKPSPKPKPKKAPEKVEVKLEKVKSELEQVKSNAEPEAKK